MACAGGRRQKRYRLWQHPYWDNAEEDIPAVVSQQLLNHPAKIKYIQYCKMGFSTFDNLDLLDPMETSLSRRDTNYRLCVSAKERQLLFLRLQRLRRLEKQAEDDINKARKNAKIEQYLKIVDARGQVNKRKMIERWLQNVEAERKEASPIQIKDTKSSVTKVMKQQPVRRSARLKSKKQSNETEKSA